MSLVFPLSPAEFLDRFPVQSVRFHCVPQVTATGLAGGDVLTAEVSPAMWQGSYTFAPMRPRLAAEFEVLMGALQRPGASFFAYKKNQIGPANDRNGDIVSGLSLSIAGMSSETNVISISGLPPGFFIEMGDFMSFDFGASPVGRALHQALEPARTYGNGNTIFFNVMPPIDPAAAKNVPITLVRASCKAVVVPGSVDLGTTSGNMTVGATFAFRQTFR